MIHRRSRCARDAGYGERHARARVRFLHVAFPGIENI